MNRTRKFPRGAKLSAAVCCSALLLVLSVCAAAKGRPKRVDLFPRLQAGQSFAYQIRYHSDKHIKTDSPVIVATPADSAKVDISALVHLEVISVQAQGDRSIVHARTEFAVLDFDSHSKVPAIEQPASQLQKQNANEKSIEFTILPDGRLDQVTGLDALLPEQQQAWHDVIQSMRADGTMRRIFEKYFPADLARQMTQF